jgi:hypothetical protein
VASAIISGQCCSEALEVSTIVLCFDNMCRKKFRREDTCQLLYHGYLARGFEDGDRFPVPGFVVVGLGFSARRSAGWIWSSYLHPSQQPIDVNQAIPRRTALLLLTPNIGSRVVRSVQIALCKMLVCIPHQPRNRQ